MVDFVDYGKKFSTGLDSIFGISPESRDRINQEEGNGVTTQSGKGVSADQFFEDVGQIPGQALDFVKGGPLGSAITMSTNPAFPNQAIPGAILTGLAPSFIPGGNILGLVGGALNNMGAYHDFGNDPDMDGERISYQNGLLSAPTNAPGGYVYQDGEKSNINSLGAMNPDTLIDVGGGEVSNAGDLYQGLSQTGAGIRGEDYDTDSITTFGDTTAPSDDQVSQTNTNDQVSQTNTITEPVSNYASRTNYDDEGGSDGGGDGGSVICTALHHHGFMPDSLHLADESFGKQIGDDVIRGYHSWAKPIAKHMMKRAWLTKLLSPIFMPWAKEMGFQMGILPKGHIVGIIYLNVGVPICSIIGKIIKRFKC